MTKTKDIQGLYYDGNEEMKMVKGEVTVRFTSDKIGKTLSFTFEDKHQIIVSFEQIERMITVK